MNWDAIGAIGEVIGAIAVVLSLIYLSFQIRHSTKAWGDASFRSVVDSTGDQIRAMIEPSNRGIVLKGLGDYRSLGSKEKFVFDGELLQLLVVAESSSVAHAAELVQEQLLEDWRYSLSTRYFPYRGFSEWWVSARGDCGLQFQKWIDGGIAKADRESGIWGIK
jgi:hypothetical protein